jgi:hypothetical protein
MWNDVNAQCKGCGALCAGGDLDHRQHSVWRADVDGLPRQRQRNPGRMRLCARESEKAFDTTKRETGRTSDEVGEEDGGSF